MPLDGINGAYILNDDINKVVRIFPNIDHANAAVSLLRLDGIETMIASEDTGDELPPLQTPRGVRLLVKEVDVFRARRILKVGFSMMDKDDEQDWAPVTDGLLKHSRRRAPLIAGLLFVVFVIPLIIALVMALGGF